MEENSQETHPKMFVVSYSSDGRMILFVRDRFYEVLNVVPAVYSSLEKFIRTKNFSKAFNLFKGMEKRPYER